MLILLLLSPALWKSGMKWSKDHVAHLVVGDWGSGIEQIVLHLLFISNFLSENGTKTVPRMCSDIAIVSSDCRLYAGRVQYYARHMFANSAGPTCVTFF
jgi:hypothetical protein